jgi:uncharacterized protein involved in exopolysaccharide biosynthesis/Mrp family chromosome partitioning ATPase
MSLADIYYVLFRHKWKVLCFFAAGLLAAALMYVFKPPLYTSAAKLYVRYVEDTRLPSRMGNDQIKLPDARGENVINSEIEILTSLDIAQEVVKKIGAEQILAKAGGGNDPARAAAIIRKNISVDVPKRSDVLKIFFQLPEQDLVQPVLTQLIASYLKKHGEIHRDLGASEGFLTGQTAELKAQLDTTEEALKEAKLKAGVASLDDAKKNNADRISNLRNDILSAQADLAQHTAVLKEFALLAPAATGSTNTGTAVPPEAMRDYRNISGRIDLLSRNEQELLTQYTETSAPVTQIRRQIADAEQAKQQLEQKYPALASVVVPSSTTYGQPSSRPIDPAAETIEVDALKAKLDFLDTQLVQARADETKVEDMETTIEELQRKKDLLEAQYRYFSSSLEQARFDEALGAGKLSNISVAQAPSPPYRDLGAINKLLAMVVAGGLLAGIALAFLIELYLDQTLKRPVEVETRLRLPLFLSIPDTARNGFDVPRAGGNGYMRLKAPGSQTAAGEPGDAATAEKMEAALWDASHRLHPFFEALRDRLVTYFDVKHLTHNPKLVAITSCAKGAGVTTVAAGLAATLSETGDGNVLLVDMTRGQGAAHPFYRGKPACSLTELLGDKKDQTKDSAQVQENLYLVSEGINGSKVPGILPKQFAYLVPKLRASDYDYIIFDMPPVSQISVTSKLGRLMDVNLMVVESEKTDRELIKQASAMVAGEKTNVGLVLNKKRTYVPEWLHQEL